MAECFFMHMYMLIAKQQQYYADAYKCFDRLWLKDCLIELWKAGMREREVLMIYKINEMANIV